MNPVLPPLDGRLPWSRRAAWVLLLLIVLLAHGVLKLWVDEALVGWGLGDKPMPARMEVSFVRALAPSAAPAPPPAWQRAAGPRVAPSPAPAASAVEAGTLPPTPAPVADTPPPAPESTASPEAPADATPKTAAAPATDALPAPSMPTPSMPASTDAQSAFEWPPSTRLDYVLTGNYRGEVHGSARVQWIRQGSRYQVHLDVMVGPSFAPLMSRRMTSDGELGADGLQPRRYDEATDLPFQAPRRNTVEFTPQQVTLANGQTREAYPGVQDTASQFVQMTWMFTTRPDLLVVGNAIMVPLALPRRMDRWIYDVLDQETLYTPLGPIDTFHLKPRRADDRPRGELSAEVWFAPTLMYLPVRIRIQQDADTFVDLMLETAPMQAAATR